MRSFWICVLKVAGTQNYFIKYVEPIAFWLSSGNSQSVQRHLPEASNAGY